MGLFRRAELHAAVHRTLADLRATIPSDTVRARFDRLFRPRGEWIADLHDAALSWARLRVPGITWGSARRALAGIHWLPPGDSLPANEAVPRALYGLTVMAAMDSDGFERVRAELQRSDSASAVVVLLLLTGYAESQKWYVDALEFFLIQPWIPGGKRARSLADLVGDYWRAAGTGATGSEAAVPEIHARLFGHPQAVPQYGVPQALFDRLVRVENPSARAWLERYGEAGLLRTLRRLPVGDTALVLLQTRDEAIRLTTIPRQSRESLNGFLEPRDAIAIDPGYSPLLALGTVVHEWQHLLFRQRQLAGFASGLSGPSPTIIALPGVEPYLAEGFAEWSTELIMAPVVARWPLLSLGELQKRAGLARNGPDDQHAIGYALVRALAEALSDPGITTSLLLRHAESPSSIVGHPTLRRAWNRHALAPERVMAIPADRILIPEVTFSVEDGFPEVISSRILVPPSGRGDH